MVSTKKPLIWNAAIYYHFCQPKIALATQLHKIFVTEFSSWFFKWRKLRDVKNKDRKIYVILCGIKLSDYIYSVYTFSSKSRWVGVSKTVSLKIVTFSMICSKVCWMTWKLIQINTLKASLYSIFWWLAHSSLKGWELFDNIVRERKNVLKSCIFSKIINFNFKTLWLKQSKMWWLKAASVLLEQL